MNDKNKNKIIYILCFVKYFNLIFFNLKFILTLIYFFKLFFASSYFIIVWYKIING